MARARFDWNKYMIENLKYPPEGRENEVQGKVRVHFVVEKDGSITNIGIKENIGIGGGLPEEAFRIILNMPGKWFPGTQNGEPVRSFVTIPINYNLAGASTYRQKGYGVPLAKKQKLTKGAEPTVDEYEYFLHGIKYPDEAKKNNIEGIVKVEFIVDNEGNVKNAKIIQGNDIGHGLDKEALRLIEQMPKWHPALDKKKRPTSVSVRIPIHFYIW